MVRPEPFGSPVAQALSDAANAVTAIRYGSPDQTPLRFEEFDPAQGGVFLVCYLGDRPVGCGGFRRADIHSANPLDAARPTAEIKRMYVEESVRRTGIGRRLLAALEAAAVQQAYARLVLDTGSKQTEAMALYESAGFEPIPGYSIYRCSPHNHAYGKDLAQPEGPAV